MDSNSFAGRRRMILDALQAEMMNRPPAPAMPAFGGSLPQGLSRYESYSQMQPPTMGMNMANPPRPMSLTGPTPEYWQHWNLPASSQMMGGLANPPANVPMPQQRAVAAPSAPAQPPTQPQRPADVPAPNAAQAGPMGQEMQPGAYGQIRGFNPLAAIGDPQAYAAQFAGGNMNNIAARTYRNDDGSMWNDYYLINPGA